MIGRLKAWLKGWLYGDILEAISAARHEAVTTQHRLQMLEGKTVTTQFRLEGLEHQALTVLSRVDSLCVAILGDVTEYGRRAERAEQGTLAATEEVLRTVHGLETSLLSLGATVGQGWREFEAVDFAVDKVALDPDLRARSEEEQIREAMEWTERYCRNNGWTPPARLRDLVVLKRLLNQGRTVSRHG